MAISLRFGCDICCNFSLIAATLHQIFNMFETSVLKSPLVYICDFHRELESDKNCFEKCAKHCTKNRMSEPAFKKAVGKRIYVRKGTGYQKCNNARNVTSSERITLNKCTLIRQSKAKPSKRCTRSPVFAKPIKVAHLDFSDGHHPNFERLILNCLSSMGQAASHIY